MPKPSSKKVKQLKYKGYAQKKVSFCLLQGKKSFTRRADMSMPFVLIKAYLEEAKNLEKKLIDFMKKLKFSLFYFQLSIFGIYRES
jgi:hypothetical protein